MCFFPPRLLYFTLASFPASLVTLLFLALSFLGFFFLSFFFAAMFRRFSRFTLKEKLPVRLTPAPQQTQSPTAPPPKPQREESILPSRRTEAITLQPATMCVRGLSELQK